jgi:hypothetical protein
VWAWVVEAIELYSLVDVLSVRRGEARTRKHGRGVVARGVARGRGSWGRGDGAWLDTHGKKPKKSDII